MSLREWFAEPIYRILKCDYPGYLAVSGLGSPLRIGVFAYSAEDARTRFMRAANEWQALLTQPPSLLLPRT